MPFYEGYVANSSYGRPDGRSGYGDVRESQNWEDSRQSRSQGGGNSHNRARSQGTRWEPVISRSGHHHYRPASEDRYKLFCPSVLDTDPDTGESTCDCGRWVFRDRNKWDCKCGRKFDYSEKFWRASMLAMRPGDDVLEDEDLDDPHGPYAPWSLRNVHSRGQPERPQTSPVYGGSASMEPAWPAASAAQWPAAAGGQGSALRARSQGAEPIARLDPDKSFADDPVVAASIARVREGGNSLLADQMAAELGKAKPVVTVVVKPELPYDKQSDLSSGRVSDAANTMRRLERVAAKTNTSLHATVSLLERQTLANMRAEASVVAARVDLDTETKRHLALAERIRLARVQQGLPAAPPHSCLHIPTATRELSPDSMEDPWDSDPEVVLLKKEQMAQLTALRDAKRAARQERARPGVQAAITNAILTAQGVGSIQSAIHESAARILAGGGASLDGQASMGPSLQQQQQLAAQAALEAPVEPRQAAAKRIRSRGDDAGNEDEATRARTGADEMDEDEAAADGVADQALENETEEPPPSTDAAEVEALACKAAVASTVAACAVAAAAKEQERLDKAKAGKGLHAKAIAPAKVGLTVKPPASSSTLKPKEELVSAEGAEVDPLL